MAPVDFRQVDVFGRDPYTGNPVAVVLDAHGLSDEDMARISTWTNLSECTFVLPPTDPAADYRVRIFSLASELPFAGHPTLGTARAWLDAGGTPRTPGRLVQECGIGLVDVRRDGEHLAFAAPAPVRTGPVDEEYLARACRVLGLARDRVVDAHWVDNGPGWVGLRLASAAEVLALSPDAGVDPDDWFIGVVGPQPDGADSDVEVRGFFTPGDAGLREDPVTGSLNASLAQWLTESGAIAAPYTAAQGTVLGRRGRVSVTEADGELWIGGATHVAVRGAIDLPR